MSGQATDLDQTDAFDGIFDNQKTAVRELVRDGIVVARVTRFALDSQAAKQFGMTGPFGSYPARPNFTG